MLTRVKGLLSGIVLAVSTQAGGQGGSEVHIAISGRPESLEPQRIASPLDDVSRTVVSFLFEGLLRYSPVESLDQG